MDKKTIPLNEALQTILLNRLLFPFVFSALLVMVLASAYGGKLVENQQMRYSRSISYVITNFLTHAGSDLRAIGRITLSSSPTTIEKVLTSNRETHRVFDTIYLLDQNKTIKALTPHDPRYIGLDMSRQKYFIDLDCGAGVNYSIPFTSLRTERSTAYLTYCIEETGEYLVGELSLNTLQETIANLNNGASDIVFIVDQTGTLLAHPNFTLVEQHLNVADWRIVQQGLEANTSAVYWRENKFWIGSASKISPTDWIVVAEVPLTTVYAPYIFAGIVLALVFMAIFSFAISAFLMQLKRKLVDPLVYLTRNVDLVAHGNYSPTEMRLDGTIPFFEISSLLSNFRNMRGAILTRETELKKSEEQYRRLLENSPDAILLHRNTIIFYANSAAVNLYAAKDASQIIGVNILDLVHPNSRPMAQLRLKKLEDRELVLPLAEIKNIRFDKSVFDAEVTTSSIIFGGDTVAQSIVRDITKRKSEEEALKYRATHDPLTDLPNRFLFQDRLKRALIHSKRNQTFGAVLYLDLDGFKSVNDAYGHSVGDQTLRHFADSLRDLLREEDTVARLSGDEFVILLERLTDPIDSERVASNIIHAFSEPYLIEGKEVFVSFSVGISIFPTDGADTETLLQSADAAMYQAKEEGKHRAKFYAPYMRSQSLERISIQKQLSHAQEENQLFLLYQPQVEYPSGRIIGVEALLRWQHPELGLVSPGKFIPIAEETGQILPIGEWVLQTACKQIQQWIDKDQTSIRVAVNLSNLQLKQADIAHTIKKAIEDWQIPPSLLEIELMENIVFRNADSSFSSLYALKEIGIALAMDDFGAGFSTLGYLAHIPFDRIKIDQNLIANIQNAKDAAVVSGIITICNNLNLEVLAEGVETQEQLAFCVEKGCNYFQGWYYSPAVNSIDTLKYAKGNAPWKKSP